MTHQLDGARDRGVAARWCALAEQRLKYLTELFESGRWRRFHSEVAFLENIREAKAAVEAWRDLSSRKASRDNRAIDMSWLGRTGAAVPRSHIWRNPPQPVEIPAANLLEDSIVPEAEPARAGEAFSARATGDDTAELAQGFVAIAERYPLLRNAL